MSLNEIKNEDEVYPLIIKSNQASPIEVYNVSEAIHIAFLYTPSTISIEGTDYVVTVSLTDTIIEVEEDINYMLLTLSMED